MITNLLILMKTLMQYYSPERELEEGQIPEEEQLRLEEMLEEIPIVDVQLEIKEETVRGVSKTGARISRDIKAISVIRELVAMK